MSIKRINVKDLLDYEGKEGLILQGCGGDPQEWVDGINEMLTKQEILLVFCSSLPKGQISTWANSQCGVWELIKIWVAHGFLIL